MTPPSEPLRWGFFVLTSFSNPAKIHDKALVIQPSGTGSVLQNHFLTEVFGSWFCLKGAASMVHRDLNILKIGTWVKLIGGLRIWEYRGTKNGKIVLCLPASAVSILVNESQVDWGSILSEWREKAKIPT